MMQISANGFIFVACFVDVSRLTVKFCSGEAHRTQKTGGLVALLMDIFSRLLQRQSLVMFRTLLLFAICFLSFAIRGNCPNADTGIGIGVRDRDWNYQNSRLANDPGQNDKFRR